MSVKSILNRVKAACEKDPSIVLKASEVQTHGGFTLEYLESLGLRKSDLKTLAKNGLAIQGYTPHYAVYEHKGKTVYNHYQGMQVRYALVAGGDDGASS